MIEEQFKMQWTGFETQTLKGLLVYCVSGFYVFCCSGFCGFCARGFLGLLGGLQFAASVFQQVLCKIFLIVQSLLG